VLIHGLGSARTVWSLVAPALAKNFEVIGVDLPGQVQTPWVPGTKMDPRSLADAVAQALDRLGVRRAHLVGNSLGGWTALELAAACPERVASVTALAPAGMRDKPLQRVRLGFKLNRYLARCLRPVLPAILASERLRGLALARNSPVWQTWSTETCRHAAHAMAGSRSYNAALHGTLHRVAGCTLRIPASIPLTVVFGDTDTVLPAHTSQSRRYMPPHGLWLHWERCGHAIQLDCPERVVSLVKEVAGMGNAA
jgi:pimeloyl-ACP methyl ester carboxylesterase